MIQKTALVFSLISAGVFVNADASARAQAPRLPKVHTLASVGNESSYKCPFEMWMHQDPKQGLIWVCAQGSGVFEQAHFAAVVRKDWFPRENFAAGAISEVRFYCSENRVNIPTFHQVVFPTARERRDGKGIRLEIPCDYSLPQVKKAMEEMKALIWTAYERPMKFLQEAARIHHDCQSNARSLKCREHIDQISGLLENKAKQPFEKPGRFAAEAYFNVGLRSASQIFTKRDSAPIRDPYGFGFDLYQPIQGHDNSAEIDTLDTFIENLLIPCGHWRSYTWDTHSRDLCKINIAKLVSVYRSQMPHYQRICDTNESESENDMIPVCSLIEKVETNTINVMRHFAKIEIVEASTYPAFTQIHIDDYGVRGMDLSDAKYRVNERSNDCDLDYDCYLRFEWMIGAIESENNKLSSSIPRIISGYVIDSNTGRIEFTMKFGR